jgi:MerR family redox-sensitive transcriptional activator SoxR
VKKDPLISIGKMAQRTGMAVSAIRYYESEGLLQAVRSPGGSRQFARSSIRRVSFILISRQLGYTLPQIKLMMQGLPNERTPTRADWQKLGRQFSRDIDEKIERLNQLKASLSGCIGCGCLSLKACALYNPDDIAVQHGAGPRYLMGDRPE